MGQIGSLFFEQSFMNLSILVHGCYNGRNDTQERGFAALF
jgi:hypothetical protein